MTHSSIVYTYLWYSDHHAPHTTLYYVIIGILQASMLNIRLLMKAPFPVSFGMTLCIFILSTCRQSSALWMWINICQYRRIVCDQEHFLLVSRRYIYMNKLLSIYTYHLWPDTCEYELVIFINIVLTTSLYRINIYLKFYIHNPKKIPVWRWCAPAFMLRLMIVCICFSYYCPYTYS